MKIQIKIEEYFPYLIVAGFLLFVFGVVSVYKPMINKIKQNKEQSAEYAKETGSLRKLSQDGQNKPSISLINLQQGKELQGKIKNIALKNKIYLNFQNSGVVGDLQMNSNLYKLLMLEGKASGNYKNFSSFLTEIRSMSEAYIDVEKIVVSGDAGATSNITAQLTLSIFIANT